MSVTIGILDIHDGFNEESWYINNFSYTKLSDELKDYICFKKIDSLNELFQTLQESGITPDKFIGISDVEYNESYVTQCFYAQTDKTTEPDFNKLGSQIVRDGNVCGKMIFIKRNLSDESYVNFSLNDFITLVRNVFVRDAIQIDITGNCRTVEYINDVLESQIHKDTYENIRYYEYKLLDYTLTFYVNKTEQQIEDNLNVYATTIYGKKIYGTVTITLIDHQTEHPRCLNLTEKILKEIYHLFKNQIEIDRARYTNQLPLDDVNVNIDEKGGLGRLGGFPNITLNPNFFSIISNEYFRYKNLSIEPNLKDLPILQID
jgi:hypothetical protein